MKPSRSTALTATLETPVAGKGCWSLFSTALGWVGMRGSSAEVERTLVGYATPSDLALAIEDLDANPREEDWSPELRERLCNFLSGEPDNFADVAVAARWKTPFQNAVIAELRKVSCGETLSYAELAARAGRPGAARAVGQVMATNPVPLIVPCHRVLGSGGRLGGFSAPTGLELKRRLLELESAGTLC